MKLSQAKEYLPLIQAAAEGKTIQWSDNCGAWSDYKPNDPCWFSDEPSEYRIKPEPKLRAWRPDDVPVGALWRPKGDNSNRSVIASINSGDVFIGDNWASIVGLFDDGDEHSTDGGKTWKPCGVEESA